MGRLIDESKIKYTGLFFRDIDEEILVPLSAVKRAVAMTPTEDVAPKSEIAVGIFADIVKNSKLIFDGVQNIVVMTETDFEEIKKKYTGEQT